MDVVYVNTWTGLPVEESVRMTDDRDKWRKYVHGLATATPGSRTAKKQNNQKLHAGRTNKIFTHDVARSLCDC